MSVFHWTMCGRRDFFTPDLNGFVGTTIADVRQLCWQEPLPRADAKKIAQANREGLRRIARATRNFRNGAAFLDIEAYADE